MRIELAHIVQFGHSRYYPDNYLSEELLDLMHKKSFTLKQVKHLKEIGFTIVIIERPVASKV